MTAVMICLGGPASRSEPDVLRLLDVLFSSETGADESIFPLDVGRDAKKRMS